MNNTSKRELPLKESGIFKNILVRTFRNLQIPLVVTRAFHCSRFVLETLLGVLDVSSGGAPVCVDFYDASGHVQWLQNFRDGICSFYTRVGVK